MRKSFKEVFSQRGKEVSGEDLISGACYLFSKKYEDEWDVIHEHEVTTIDGNETIFCCKAQLFDNKSVYAEGFIRRSEIGRIYEATEDQIALLKEY